VRALTATAAPFLVGFALVLLVLHPVFLMLILAAEVAFVAGMAVAIARSAGVVIPTPWRST
jgi:hypothetical protein